MDLKEVGWRDVDWIDLPQDRGKWRAFLNAVMKVLVLSNAGDFLNAICRRRSPLHGVSWSVSARVGPPCHIISVK
jgi:hypothetical protein